MVEFVTIKEAVDTHKGNIRGVIIKASELKAGTGKGGDWTMKVFTLQDTSGEVDITCWNTEIGRLAVGQYYEIESPWWKERQDKPGVWNLGLGDYCKVTKSDNPPVQGTQVTNSTSEPPAPTKTPQISPALREFVMSEDLALLQIEQVIEENHKALGIEKNGQKVGMHTKEIYREAKKTNLTKASDMK